MHTYTTYQSLKHRSYLGHIHSIPQSVYNRHGHRNMRAHACAHLHTQQECIQCTYKHMYIGLYKYSSPTYIMHNVTMASFSVDSGKRSCSGLLPGLNTHRRPFSSVTLSTSQSPHTPQSNPHFPNAQSGTQGAA